jgi:hypothetical protein
VPSSWEASTPGSWHFIIRTADYSYTAAPIAGPRSSASYTAACVHTNLNRLCLTCTGCQRQTVPAFAVQPFQEAGGFCGFIIFFALAIASP